jgi:hypothetical protein
MLSETEYDSADSYITGINDYIETYSSRDNSRNTTRNNSYKSDTGEMLMNSNCNLKKIKNALHVLNEELKYKLFETRNEYYLYIHTQVLKELKEYFHEIKHFKLLYNIVIKEFKNRYIYRYGKMYMELIESL